MSDDQPVGLFKKKDSRWVGHSANPELAILPCECGLPECKRFIVAMVNAPTKDIMRQDGSAFPATVVYLGAEDVQGLVNDLRRWCWERGIEIK